MQGVKIHFRYDSQKGLAMLEYLLKKVGGRYNQMALLKLAFFSDRYHVRKYARPVSSDEYYALKLGPIPSNLKDIIFTEEYLSDKFHFPGDYTVELKTTDIDIDQFSKSDIEAMEFALQHFAELGRNDEFFLAHLTHAYPEWSKYEERFSDNPYGREEMDYKDFLLNADPNHPEFRKLNFEDPFPVLSDEEREDIYNEMLERTIAFA